MAELTVKLDDQLAYGVYDEAKRSYNGDVNLLMQDALNAFLTMKERFQSAMASGSSEVNKEEDPDRLIAKHLASENGLTSAEIYSLGERLTKIAKMYEDQKNNPLDGTKPLS